MRVICASAGSRCAVRDPNCFGVTDVKDLPKEGPYFMILVERSFTYDDGYGDRGQSSTSTHRSLETTVCRTQEALNAWVLENDTPRYGAPAVYTIVRVNPVQVKKTVSFEFRDL